jgi:serine/threonine protein kinase
MDARMTDAPAAPPPETVGPYKLVQELGRGGMGTVWLAQHTLIGHNVVIKFLNEEHARRPEISQRFLTEARASNAIDSPDVVKVHDFGYTPDGIPYIVMEHLRGRPLDRYLEAMGVVPEATVRAIGVRLARALAAAHAKRIVHRDLKPPNIFLVVDPDDATRARVKILDFGIAKLMDGGDLRADVATRTGAVMGTPAYMSPEQCTGEAVDHRTDVYALGIVLYELLVATLPFKDSNFGKLITKHVTAPPPPLRQMDPRISEDLERTVLRCLAKLPDDRFQTMTDLGQALAGPRAADHIPADGSISGPMRSHSGATSLSGPASTARTSPSGPAPRTPVERPANPSTLGSGAAESRPVAPAPARPKRTALFVTGALALLVAASAAAVFGRGLLSTDSDDDPATEHSAPPERVHKTAAPDAPADPLGPPTDHSAPPETPTTVTTTAEPSPPASTAPTSAAPAPLRTVILRIESVPAGAAVEDATTGERLGETPHELEVPAGSPRPRLRLLRAGYDPSEVAPATDRSDTTVVKLKRRAAAKAPRTATSGTASPRTVRGVD